MSITMLIKEGGKVDIRKGSFFNIPAQGRPTVFQQYLICRNRLKIITFTGVFNISTASTKPK